MKWIFQYLLILHYFLLYVSFFLRILLLSFASFHDHTPIYCSRTLIWFESQSDFPPPQEETFFILFSVSPAYFRKDFLTPDHLVTKPRSLEVSFDIFILRWIIYGWGMCDFWPTYTLRTLYSIGKLNLKFNQQNYVDIFLTCQPTKVDPPSLPDQSQEKKKNVERVTLENGLSRAQSAQKFT